MNALDRNLKAAYEAKLQPNSPIHKLAFLDSLRGIAIAAVLGFHTLGYAFGADRFAWSGMLPDFALARWSFVAALPLHFGYLGVAIFFVVSGFCIHLSFAKSSGSFADFFTRRFFRIYPPYALCLVAFFAFSGESLRHLWLHAALVHNFSDDAFFSIVSSFWSIAVEAQLYVLYPLLVWYAARKGWGQCLVVTAIIEIAIRAYCAFATATNGPGFQLPRALEHNPFAYWFSWTIGAYLADAYVNRRVIRSRPVLAAIFLVATIASHFFLPAHGFTFLFAAVTTALAITIMMNRKPESGGSSILSRAITKLGVVSYSLYLIHDPLMAYVRNAAVAFGVTKPVALLAICGLSIAPIYWCSVVLYKFVELPSINAGKRLLRAKPTSVLP